jgi:hypothetical protein
MLAGGWATPVGNPRTTLVVATRESMTAYLVAWLSVVFILSEWLFFNADCGHRFFLNTILNEGKE